MPNRDEKMPSSFLYRLPLINRYWSEDHAVATLSGILASVTPPQNEPAELLLALEDLLFWFKRGRTERIARARFRYFFTVLEKNEPYRRALEYCLRSVLEHSAFLPLFLHTGYAADHGLWSDVTGRVTSRFFPTPAENEVHEIIFHVFRTESDLHWLEALPEDCLQELAQWLGVIEPEAWAPVRENIREALVILSTNLVHHGLSEEIRRRMKTSVPVKASSYLRLNSVLHAQLLEDAAPAGTEGSELPRIPESGVRPESLIPACRADIQTVYGNMEETGVSVALVHKLELMMAILDQIEELLILSHRDPELPREKQVRDFLIKAARAGIRSRSVRAHLKRHFYLLSRKIAERNGSSGEHYVARGAREIRTLLLSAIGGGLIVVLMTIFKTLWLRSEPAPIFLAMGVWIVYAAGFLGMQATGCTLATKIPSFTASHLAHELKELRTRAHAQAITEEFMAVVASQALALLGNVIGVIALGLLVSLALGGLFHTALMDSYYAEHTLAGTQPWTSFALFQAALTGIELWLSSLAGGWFENWVVFRGIPRAIARNPRLTRVLGPGRAHRLSELTLKNASGVATNLALSFLFAFVPLLGAGFGLVLDGRHVTISTTSALFAAATLSYRLSGREWAGTVIGLLLIGMMNFLFSFSFALFVALRAQNVRTSWLSRMLLKEARRRFGFTERGDQAP